MFQPETTGLNRPTSTWTPEGVPQSEKEWSDRGNGEYETYYDGEYDGEYAASIVGDVLEEDSDFWESDSEGWRLKDGRYIPLLPYQVALL